MLIIPENTKFQRVILYPNHKDNLVKTLKLNKSFMELLDKEISQIQIINCLSPNYFDNLNPGVEVKEIYFVKLFLRQKDYNITLIEKLLNFIKQKMLVMIIYDHEYQFAVKENKSIFSKWYPEEFDIEPPLSNDMDKLWEQILITCFSITLQANETLQDRINIMIKCNVLHKEVALLQQKGRKEKQPRRKVAIFEQILKLNQQIEHINNASN